MTIIFKYYKTNQKAYYEQTELLLKQYFKIYNMN